ncbi:hypothetical protein KR222_008605 [Zaprionus bogoriensis]|nr:hypothetical protein KR222_008605 [Zaprionus bogoriensis]
MTEQSSVADSLIGALNMENIVDGICKRLKIIAVDVEKVQRAKELLLSLQRRKAFINLFGLDDDDSINENLEDMQRLTSLHSLRKMSRMIVDDTESDLIKMDEEFTHDSCEMPFEEERWHNYFTGYQILSLPEGLDSNENRKCIELCPGACNQDLKMYLLSGIRCFMLDLFCGPLKENQDLIVQLREAEITVSKEYGFPVVSTIVAKLSPRYQYTGYLEDSTVESIDLPFGTKVILTTDRTYSRRCTGQLIYVNARFLLFSVRRFDIIPIGQEIQLKVRSVRQDHMLCCVCRAGALHSYMPVLFPKRCARYSVSYEEVEDLTFAREVGLNVIISNVAGSVAYVDNMEFVMQTLQCQNMRLFARVVLNEMMGCKEELNWIAERYDGFLVEFAKPENAPDIMQMCRNAECFMQLAYAAKKPIILDPWQINVQNLRIDPSHYYYAFYYPDKYLVKSKHTFKVFYFNFLQSAIFEQISRTALAKMPMCDSSHTGADGLARAVVTASMEIQAKAIVVCGVTTRMVQKISHFRPQAPIIFISHMRSAEDYASVFHNVTMVSFRTKFFMNHRRNTFRKAVFAVAYLASRKIVKQGDRIILVYNYDSGTNFPEKYLIYKFSKFHFVEHLSATLFPLLVGPQALRKSTNRPSSNRP